MPFALCATGALALFLAGCRKEEAKPEIPASSPASYMNDTNFIGRLSADRRERQKLLSERTVVVGKMKAMIDAKRAELGAADQKAIKAALDADPAWQELERQMKAANAKVEEHRKKTLGAVRERIAPGRSGRETASPVKSRSGEDAASPVKSGSGREIASPVKSRSGGDAASPREKPISK